MVAVSQSKPRNARSCEAKVDKDMSAMHWEARRRQSALERRAANRQQLLQEDSALSAPHSVSEPSPSAESKGGEQCPHCKSTMKSPDSAAKIPNRYSSLQYKQQW